MNTPRTRTLLTLTAVSVAILATASFAQQEPRGMMFPFEAADADKDGKVTEAELDALRAAEAKAMDSNGDGKLTVEELTAAHLARMTARATEMATRRVEAQDTDGDMALSAAELASRPMPAMLFGRADADNDGAVTEAELEAMHAEMGERHGENRDGRHGKGGHKPRHGMIGDN